MKRPILMALCFCIGGILAAQYLPTSGVALFFCAALALCLCLFLKWRWKPVFIFIAFGALGILRLYQSAAPLPPELYTLISSGDEALFCGVVRHIDYTQSGRQKILLEARETEMDGKLWRSPVKIQAILPLGEETEYGMALKLSGSLKEPSGLRNPGGFNEKAYMLARGVYYKCFPTVVEKGQVKNDPRLFLYNIKSRMSDVFEKTLPEKEANVMKSIVLGDRSGLSEEVRALYSDGGISHILVISGLHISILALGVNKLLNLFLGRKPAGIIVIIFLTAYCVMTGGNASTVRAVLMSSLIIVSSFLYRKSDLLASAAFSCLCLLLFRPYFLWDIGFQLSFACVFSLAFASGPFEIACVRLTGRFPVLRPVLGRSAVSGLLGGCLAIFFALTPITAFHFYFFSPYTISANLLVLPTASFIVVLGFLAGIIGMLNLTAALFISGSLFYTLNFYEWICGFFTCLPSSKILTGSWPVPVMLTYFFAFAVFIWWMDSDKHDLHKRKKFLLPAACIFLISFFMWKAWPVQPEVTMLDVGQGDCFVIRRGKQVYIIDGGGWGGDYANNTGNMILMPFLDYYGVGSIDGVFVTHGDSDHITGILELVGQKNIENIYLPRVEGETSIDDLTDRLISSAESYKIPIVYLTRGDMVKGEELAFSCLHPTGNEAGNAASLVLMLDIEGSRCLFTGDIDQAVENKLLAEGHELKANVLKLAHHGSKYSTGRLFLEAAAPELAIVSVGEGNRYGHPARETMDKLKAAGIPCYVTAEQGAVRIYPDNNGLWVETLTGAGYEKN